ncbi:MAG: hypothetical protein ACM3MK_05315 [Chitinophagales bacterium]
MTKHLAEVIIYFPSVLATGLLIFVAGAIQGVMNDYDEAGFQHFLRLLHKHATRSPFAVITASFLFVGCIPYFIFYGFGNWWFTAGIILFWLASIASKSFNLPIYNRIFAFESTDTVRLREERKKLQTANMIRAAIQFISVVLLTIGII